MQWKKDDNEILFRTRVTASEQKRAEKLLSLYFRLPAIIEGNRLAAQMKTTPSYEIREGKSYPKEGGESWNVYTHAAASINLQTNLKAFEVLSELYHGLPEELRQLWFVRYEPRNMHNCETAMLQLHISNRNTYFDRKFQLIGYIMDAFDLWEDEE